VTLQRHDDRIACRGFPGPGGEVRVRIERGRGGDDVRRGASDAIGHDPLPRRLERQQRGRARTCQLDVPLVAVGARKSIARDLWSLLIRHGTDPNWPFPPPWQRRRGRVKRHSILARNKGFGSSAAGAP